MNKRKNPNATRGMVSMQQTAADSKDHNETPFLMGDEDMEYQCFSQAPAQSTTAFQTGNCSKIAQKSGLSKRRKD